MGGVWIISRGSCVGRVLGWALQNLLSPHSMCFFKQPAAVTLEVLSPLSAMTRVSVGVDRNLRVYGVSSPDVLPVSTRSKQR